MSKISNINLKVHLDDKNLPDKIYWSAEDSSDGKENESKTLLLSVWDKQEKVTMGIDLWTKDMTVEEMNIHFLQIFNKLADTYKRATNNTDLSSMIDEFALSFAEKLNLKK